MDEKDAFDKIVEALEHQNFYIHKNYYIKYKDCRFVIKFCKWAPAFLNILLFIDEIGRNDIKKFLINKHGMLIKLDIQEVKTYD